MVPFREDLNMNPGERAGLLHHLLVRVERNAELRPEIKTRITNALRGQLKRIESRFGADLFREDLICYARHKLDSLLSYSANKPDADDPDYIKGAGKILSLPAHIGRKYILAKLNTHLLLKKDVLDACLADGSYFGKQVARLMLFDFEFRNILAQFIEDKNKSNRNAYTKNVEAISDLSEDNLNLCREVVKGKIF